MGQLRGVAGCSDNGRMSLESSKGLAGHCYKTKAEKGRRQQGWRQCRRESWSGDCSKVQGEKGGIKGNGDLSGAAICAVGNVRQICVFLFIPILSLFQLQFNFHSILFRFQVYSIVVRQSCTSQQVPPEISSAHLAPHIVITVLLTVSPMPYFTSLWLFYELADFLNADKVPTNLIGLL